MSVEKTDKEILQEFKWQKEYEQILIQVAKSLTFPDNYKEWKQLKPLLKAKLSQTLNSVDPQLKSDDLYQHANIIFKALDSFSDMPWTVQRLVELFLYPHQHYSDVYKYLRAIEKCLDVCSTMQDFHHKQSENLPPDALSYFQRQPLYVQTMEE